MLVNAQIVWEVHRGHKSDSTYFRLAVIKQLLQESGVSVGRHPGGNLPQEHNEARLHPGPHYPSLLPPTVVKQNPCKRCSVCSSFRRKETRYQCQICQMPLCIIPCFALFHTKLDFRQPYRRLQVDNED